MIWKGLTWFGKESRFGKDRHGVGKDRHCIERTDIFRTDLSWFGKN
jgi:hypothetical protein